MLKTFHILPITIHRHQLLLYESRIYTRSFKEGSSSGYLEWERGV